MSEVRSRRREADRLAQNIEKGYQIKVNCGVCKEAHWFRVTSALHILGPMKVSTFVTDADLPCTPPGTRFSANPRDRIPSALAELTAPKDSDQGES